MVLVKDAWIITINLRSSLASFAHSVGAQISDLPRFSVEVSRRDAAMQDIEDLADYEPAGPTIDFAASLRGNHEDAGPLKQALWRHFSTRKTGREASKFVELSQNSTDNTLRIQLDRYQPMETDKQSYSWFEDDIESHYQTPPYGIANLGIASSAIEKFLALNSDGYIEANLQSPTEITRRTFQVAQKYQVRVRLCPRELLLTTPSITYP